jgi:hypothetical protein
MLLSALSIHTLPKAGMTMEHELVFSRKVINLRARTNVVDSDGHPRFRVMFRLLGQSRALAAA